MYLNECEDLGVMNQHYGVLLSYKSVPSTGFVPYAHGVYGQTHNVRIVRNDS